MKKFLTFFVLLFFTFFSISQSFELKSPDSKITVTVSIDDNISWTCSLQNINVIDRTEIGLQFMKNEFSGESSKLLRVDSSSHSEVIEPVIPHKDARIESNYNQLIFRFRNNLNLYFRAFNDGVAYRFEYTGKKTMQVKNETLDINLPQGNLSFFPEETSLYSHNERVYKKLEIGEIKKDMFCSLPVLFQNDAIHVLFTETALHDHPGMFLAGNG
jgi:alpha-glucosidase